MIVLTYFGAEFEMECDVSSTGLDHYDCFYSNTYEFIAHELFFRTSLICLAFHDFTHGSVGYLDGISRFQMAMEACTEP